MEVQVSSCRISHIPNYTFISTDEVYHFCVYFVYSFQQKLYAEDPLIDHNGLKARISYQTLVAMDRIKNGLNDIRWPFLVQHGDDDKLSEMSGSKLLYEKAASQDKTFTVSCCSLNIWKIYIYMLHIKILGQLGSPYQVKHYRHLKAYSLMSNRGRF